MSMITPGRSYGIVGALALLAYFVIPPQIEMNGTACSIWSFAPTGCEAGVRTVYRGAAGYCVFAGYLVSRNIDREPVGTPWATALLFVVSVTLLGVPLWLALHAAFW